MLHAIKHKFDLYFDSALNVTNQVINNPKTAPISASALVGIGIVDINNALQTISIIVGLVVGGMSLWVMIEKRMDDMRARREKRELRREELKSQRLKTKSLENHIKNQSRSR